MMTVTSTATPTKPATKLTTKDLTIEYSSGGYVVRPIDHLDLTVDDGELVLLLGSSGCGKTTLLSAMASILTPTGGSIHVGDTEVTGLRGAALTQYRRTGVGIVFQAFNLVPSLTALENVAMPLWAAGMQGRKARARAADLLDSVGLADRARHRPAGLSGGQLQRVAIARALANEPPLVLADEPTAHLDYIQVEGVLRLLRDLASPGRVVVVATHDDRLLPLADRVVELSPRATEPSGPPRDVALADGEVLFRQGDFGDRVYVLDDGRIELRRDLVDGGHDVIDVLHAGVYFGELAPLFGVPRSATAVAVGPTRLTSLSVTDFRARHRA
jgi:putative ABC transport system ATP-binding protein